MALVRPKFTVFFQGNRGEGFTESWYTAAGTDYPVVVGIMDNYVARRKEALGANFVITYGRVSDDTVARDSVVKVYSDKDGSSNIPAAVGTDAGFGSDCVIHRIEAGALHRKSWMVRGLPDDEMDRNFANGFDPAGPGIIAIKKLVNWMVAVGIGIRVKTGGGPPPTYTYLAITSGQAVRWSTRRCGRPFGQPVGRRLIP